MAVEFSPQWAELKNPHSPLLQKRGGAGDAVQQKGVGLSSLAGSLSTPSPAAVSAAASVGGELAAAAADGGGCAVGRDAARMVRLIESAEGNGWRE